MAPGFGVCGAAARHQGLLFPLAWLLSLLCCLALRLLSNSRAVPAVPAVRAVRAVPADEVASEDDLEKGLERQVAQIMGRERQYVSEEEVGGWVGSGRPDAVGEEGLQCC